LKYIKGSPRKRFVIWIQ